MRALLYTGFGQGTGGKMEMTDSASKCDRCVNVDNSVDFVDFLGKMLIKNDRTIKLSTENSGKPSKKY